MAGAPRTTRVRIASATSSHRAYGRTTSRRGSSVWSSSSSRPSAHQTGSIVFAITASDRAGRQLEAQARSAVGGVGLEAEVVRAVALHLAVEGDAAVLAPPAHPRPEPEEPAADVEAAVVHAHAEVRIEGAGRRRRRGRPRARIEH